MSNIVATSDPSVVQNADTEMRHGLLSDSQDMLADLAINDPAHLPSAEPTASLKSSDLENEHQPLVHDVVTGPTTAVGPTEPDGAEAGMTPEQDAAAAAFAEEFVELYELAFLSRAVCQLAEFCAAKGIPESAVAKKLRSKGIVLQDLKDRAAEVERGIAECASDEGWRLIQDGKLRLMYRHETGSTVHCFKGSCCLPGPMEQPLSMAREFDLVNSWNSYVTNSKILRTFCDIDLLVYASVWLPWPFVERDVLISAFADDRLKDKDVVAVSFASPTQTPPGVEPDLPAGADQRVHVYFTSGSCMTMKPVPALPATVTVRSSASGGDAQVTADSSSQQTQVVIVANIETGMAHVPEAVIQFVLRVFAPFMYSTVLKVLHSTFDDPTQALPKRLVEHHELYDLLRQRCQEYLDGHPE